MVQKSPLGRELEAGLRHATAGKLSPFFDQGRIRQRGSGMGSAFHQLCDSLTPTVSKAKGNLYLFFLPFKPPPHSDKDHKDRT